MNPSRFNIATIIILSLLLVVTTRPDPCDCGITSYLPSLRVFNPYYWLGWGNGTTGVGKDAPIDRSDNLRTDRISFNESSTNKMKHSPNSTPNNFDEVKVKPNHSKYAELISKVHFPTTTPSPKTTVIVTSKSPTLAAIIIQNNATDLPKVALNTHSGSIRDLFTTQRPMNVSVKVKINRKGTVYDIPMGTKVYDSETMDKRDHTRASDSSSDDRNHH